VPELTRSSAFSEFTAAPAGTHVPSASQRAAIEADLEPLLVLAGPGAGKTFCLIERIRFLIEKQHMDAEHICAFTFTNKAAEEIASRLAQLGPAGLRVKRGTIHSFCAELLREFADQVGLRTGFGIADENYQLTVLARIQGPKPWHGRALTNFSAHRFSNFTLQPNDRALFEDYERFLADRNLVDFDMLVLKAAELLEQPAAAGSVRARWKAVLVDEFQDLNSAQYRVIRALAWEHRNVFAVGDHEQSIFSWTGADRGIFGEFMNDFGITPRQRIHLRENHRCPREVFGLARILVTNNPTLFDDYEPAAAHRDSGYPVEARGFDDDDAENAWIVADILRDLADNAHSWGDIALLYRKHTIGEGIEAAFLNAGIPCRLAHGRALAEDPVVAYVVGALRVISCPSDDICRDNFFAIVLPRALFDEARAQAEAAKHDLRRQLNYMLARRPRGDEGRRQLRRALSAWRNLDATGRQHETLPSLVQELVAQRIRRLRSVLDERHDDLSDPASYPEVVRLADRLRHARERDTLLWIDRLGGAEIALKGMLSTCGFSRVQIGGSPPEDAESLSADDVPSLGLALGLFKAIQLLEIGDFAPESRNFTAVDLETTAKDAGSAEIVEIAAVRVRDGKIVDAFTSLVKPNVAIPAGATEVHGITDGEVAAALPFESVWPKFRAFCGDDVIVAHNGYEYDFMIMRRMCKSCGKKFDLCTYDTLPLARDLYPTSRKLDDLARQFGIDTGRSHRAPDDARTLARVFVKLDEAKICRGRKTAMLELLDNLGLALALTDEDSLCDEARLFLKFARVFTLGRYSSCLESYERERSGDDSILTVAEAIERLGGVKLMERIRSGKSPDERYPGAMLRLRRLIEQIPDGPRQSQIDSFLERAVLSKYDGNEPDTARVNLLTLHSTKGLEFSRVYIVGAEDAELPGGHPVHGPTSDEVEEARRLLYVGMTRAKDRLVITRVEMRRGKPTGGHQFLTEMGLLPVVSSHPD
jgi:DNA polymerase III epsilon subunit family exonuclease